MLKSSKLSTSRSRHASHASKPRNITTSSKLPHKLKKPVKKLRAAAFSTDASTAPQSTTVTPQAPSQPPELPAILPKIPKLRYLKYSSSTDVLGLLKSRGFINQVTAGVEKHFNSEADLSPTSITETLTALGASAPVAMGYLKPAIYAAAGSTDGAAGVTAEAGTGLDTGSNLNPTLLRPTARFQKRAVYAGFDPTAASLHLGNLLVILSLMHFHKAGHQVVALTGGATGMVGDPSGRSTERVLQTADQVKSNVNQINKSLLNLLQGPSSTATSTHTNSVADPSNTPIFVDNFDWYHNMSVIDFLRDVGKHFRVAAMLSKDSVKSRMTNPESDGISFTEFSYQVLQGFDYNFLHKKHGVSLQIGGSDQWGNITAGIDCIHRTKQSEIKAKAAAAAAVAAVTDAAATKTGAKGKKGGDTKSADAAAAAPEQADASEDDSAYGLTLPLLTTAQGVKFGKSMGNAIWINPSMTSSYAMYQYLLSTSDLDCRKFLNVFTFLDHESIEGIMAEHEKLPDIRIPQRILACEIVRLLHGDTGVKQALVATKLLFKDKFAVDMSAYLNPAEAGDDFESKETMLSSQLSTDATATPVSTDTYEGLTFNEFVASLDGVSMTHIPDLSTHPAEALEKIDTHPLSIVNLAVASKLVASKSEAKRLIKQNGLSLYQDKVKDDFIVDPKSDMVKSLPFGRVLMLKSGQKKIHFAILPEQPL